MPRPFQFTGSHTLSWAFSLLFHGVMVGFAVVLMTDLRLAPQPEPFKWDVSVFESAPTPTQRSAQSQPVAESRPVEPQPVVQTVQEVIQREVRTVTPVVQAVSQPIQSETQVIARTAQPIETPSPAAMEQPSAAATSAQPAQPINQPAGVQTMPVRSTPAPQRDYGWLAETLRDRIEELKRYPPMARMNNWQGKVVLKFVVKEDGTVENLEVVQSSGHTVLDEAAMETIRRASPLPLKHELGKPRVTFQFPISYTLR